MPWPELERFSVTTPSLVSEASRILGDQAAISDGGTTLTWRQLGQQVELKANLIKSHGVQRGDVVSIQLPNWWETVVYTLATWQLGAIANPVTPIYRGSELRTIFEMAQPALVLCPQDFGGIDYLTMSEQALAEASNTAPVAVVERGADGILATGLTPSREFLSDVNNDEVSSDSVSLLMFTSGTTGRPKGVLHSHRTLLYETWSIADRFSLQQPRVFMPSPLTHITGLLYGILLPILTHGSVVLQDRWDTSTAVDLIEQERCTFCVGATPFLAGLVQEYGRRGHDSCLDSFVCGGADVPPDVISAAESVMGTIAVRAYGMTEIPTLTCGSPRDSVSVRSNDDGALIGNSEARLVDCKGEIGSLEARCPEMFLGYLDPTDNQLAFTLDGWLRTGDLALMRGPNIQIVGREKDIISRGGENISPVEVEVILRELPGVLEIAVVGVPDGILGERACAMIVPDGKPPTLADLVGHIDSNQLARQKAPEHLLICLNGLPRTASGKIQRYLLREIAIQRLGNGEGESR